MPHFLCCSVSVSFVIGKSVIVQQYVVNEIIQKMGKIDRRAQSVQQTIRVIGNGTTGVRMLPIMLRQYHSQTHTRPFPLSLQERDPQQYKVYVCVHGTIKNAQASNFHLRSMGTMEAHAKHCLEQALCSLELFTDGTGHLQGSIIRRSFYLVG